VSESTKGYVVVESGEETAPRSAKGTETKDRRAPNRGFAVEVLKHK
jgi:hypothetical protein